METGRTDARSLNNCRAAAALKPGLREEEAIMGPKDLGARDSSTGAAIPRS